MLGRRRRVVAREERVDDLVPDRLEVPSEPSAVLECPPYGPGLESERVRHQRPGDRGLEHWPPLRRRGEGQPRLTLHRAHPVGDTDVGHMRCGSAVRLAPQVLEPPQRVADQLALCYW